MSIFREYRTKINEIISELQSNGTLPQELKIPNFSVEPPREEKHGDLSTNIAMILCKAAGMKPRDLADIFLEKIALLEGVKTAEIAGAGFINLFLEDHQWHEEIQNLLEIKGDYGSSDIGQNKRVNIEYVSANPTGPLHVGHVRGAVFGDALANLLEYCGYKTIKEYYINDAGTQIDVLARSCFLRYREALGEDIGTIPEGYYPGEYLIPVGKALAEQYGEELKSWDESKRHEYLCDYAPKKMMDQIRDDLEVLSIKHDIFTSEKEMIKNGAVEKALNFLAQAGLIYEGVLEPPKGKVIEDWEERPQTLFKSSLYGDDTDRPICKSDGKFTYFATDIAYHYDKFKRGADLLINVWGADHGGYVKRITAAMKAMTNNKAELQVKLCQIVHLFKNGEPYKMSKRAGSFVTLRDIVDEVGADVVRFMMLSRKNDAQLDFDFSKALEQSKDNPVFYVQYAHARICSVLRNAKEQINAETDKDSYFKDANFTLLKDVSELGLMKKIAEYPRLIEQAAESAEPHRITFYLGELAGMFHAFWNKGKENQNLRFILPDDLETTKARLALIHALSLVIASGLNILGVEAVREM